MSQQPLKVAIVGAGWAGCAAAVEAARLGHSVAVFEASRIAGGRARRVDFPGGSVLDNGQHILIGAYAETLALMRFLDIKPETALLRTPLTLRFPDGNGLALPRLAAPLDAVVGIARAKGWRWKDKFSLFKAAAMWQIQGFECAAQTSVAQLCSNISRPVMHDLIEPLCVSALNTPAERASGQVFLRVLRDSLFAGSGGSNLLLPKVDLSALLPDAALNWLQAQGHSVHLGQRVSSLAQANGGWTLVCEQAPCEAFDAVILACPALEAARLAESAGVNEDWQNTARALQYEAIATVYLSSPGSKLPEPMLALHSTPLRPAQFVFDRGQLGGPPGLMALVVSASTASSAVIAEQVLHQAAEQLGFLSARVLHTIVEKRATFACTPGLERPASHLATGLIACGDYTQGPYPATLEGAVRSGLQAARALSYTA